MNHKFREKKPERKKSYRPGMLRYLLLVTMTACSLLAKAQLAALKEKVSINQSPTTALSVIEAIDRQSNYRFTYAGEQLSVIAIPAFKVEAMELGEVLSLLQKNYGLQFAVRDGNISVRPGAKPDTKPASSATRATGKVMGTVIDEENGSPWRASQ